MKWFALALLVGCASEDTPGRRQIRPGGEPDLGRDAAADAGAADASGDAAVQPIDMTVDSGRGPDPAVWYVLHHDAAEAGLRAALVPPQAPAGDAVAATAPAPLLVRWQGPESPGAQRLLDLLDAGRTAAPFYDMADRAPSAATDGSWLVARALQHPRALRVDDRPVLALRPTADRAGLSDLRARLAVLPVAPFVVLEVPIDTRPWPAADAILPALPYGQPLDRQGEPAHAEDALRRRAEREAALAAGWKWLPRAGPPANRRLTEPEGRVFGGPDEADLVRSLVLARRAVTAPAVVVVDGLGAWADDRQLDAVAGAATAAPTALTDGRTFAAYGSARLDAVVAWLGPGHAPELVLQPPVLLGFSGNEGPQIVATEGALEVVSAGGPATWLISAAPFRLASGATLRYARSTTVVAVDLRFDDGSALSDVLPASEAIGPQAVPLAAFAGRIVHEVLLEARGPGTVADVRIEVR